MLRTLLTLLGCFVAVLAADVLFRGSVLQHLWPVILSPSERGVLTPPVHLEWQGPDRLRVLLGPSGGEKQDLGVTTSPLTLEKASFPREGSYELELQSPRFGKWVTAHRSFQLYEHPPAATPAPTPPRDPFDRPVRMKDLLRALRAARTAREKATERTRFLTEENLALRDESERLVKQLESLSDSQDSDSDRMAALERRSNQLAEDNRNLADEVAALRLRLSAANVCTVWGYYSYPRPNTIPVTKRLLLVSDLRGQIFRTQADCEMARRTDTTAGSPCACVGTPLG